MAKHLAFCFGAIGERSGLNVFHAAALSSLSVPRPTIFSTSSGSRCCRAFASSHGVQHPDVALLIGSQDHWHRLGMDRQEFGAVVRKP